MEFKIRTARVEDLAACRKICIETAGDRDLSTDEKRATLCNLYCDPYIEKFTEHCFVAENAEIGVFGYILCAPDVHDYSKVVKAYYRKPLLKLNKKEQLKRFFEIQYYKTIKKSASAHLHIDILPVGQKIGAGGRLMRAVLTHLDKSGTNGVFLGVSAKNENAVQFYKHFGFTIYAKPVGGYTMVKLLNNNKQMS